MKELTAKQVKLLITGFWDSIDGGNCFDCSSNAVQVLTSCFPDQKDYIEQAFDKVMEEN
jgi:hypothetical protein